MDLSTRVKEVLRGETHDTSKGDVDTSKTPGAFPDDPATPRALASEHEHEHNKLHKPNDPRGWTDEERRAHGLGAGDMTDPMEQESSYTHQPADARLDDQRATIPDQGNVLGEKRDLGDNVGSTATGTTALGSQQQSTLCESAPAGSEGETHPYWGNLPQGEGVYNTVMGHGSKEDEALHKRTMPSDTSETRPVGTTSQPEDQSPSTSQQRSMPLGATDTSGASRYETLNDPQTIQGQTLGDQKDQKDSHYKEGLAAGAAAGVAAAGAYGLEKKHVEEKDRQQAPDTADPEAYNDKKDSKMFSLFRRSSKSSPTTTRDDTVEPEQAAEKREGRRSFSLFHSKSAPKEKDVTKEETATKEPKPEKEKKLAGLFHRSHEEKKPSDPEFKEPVYEEQKEQKDQSHGKMAPALALTGAGGAAAYAATRGHDDDAKATDKTTGQNVQPMTQSTDTQQGIMPPATGQYGTKSSGTGQKATMPSGIGQYGTMSTGTGQYEQSPAQSGSQYNTLSSGTPSGIQPHDYTAPSQQPMTQGKQHSSLPAAAGLGAAGLGAGALTVKGLEKRREERGEQSTVDTSKGMMPGQISDTTGMSPGSMGSQDPSFGMHDTPATTRDNNVMSEVPMTKHANKGEYNVLSSGTPSGVKIDETPEPTPLASDKTRDPLSRDLPIRDSQDKHIDSKAAAGIGAAGLGATGLGAISHRRPEEKDVNQPSTLRETSNTQEKHTGSKAAAGLGAGLGAAGIGAATREHRRPEDKEDFSQPSALGGMRDTRTHPSNTADLGATGLGTAALESRKEPERPIGESTILRQSQGETGLPQEKEMKHSNLAAAGMGAAGLGAAGLGAYVYEHRKPEETGKEQLTEKPYEQREMGQRQFDTMGQRQSEQTSQHRDAKAAAVAAFGRGHHIDEQPYTPVEQARWKQSPPVAQTEERSLPTGMPTGSAFGGGVGGGLNKMTHRCTKCGEENDISQYFTGTGMNQ